MYARVERFNLPQNMADVAKDLVARIEPILRRQPGFASLNALLDETSGEYLLLTLWQALEDIHRFERTADEWRVRDIMSPYLTAVPEIDVYQLHNMPAAPSATGTPAEPLVS